MVDPRWTKPVDDSEALVGVRLSPAPAGGHRRGTRSAGGFGYAEGRGALLRDHDVDVPVKTLVCPRSSSPTGRARRSSTRRA